MFKGLILAGGLFGCLATAVPGWIGGHSGHSQSHHDIFHEISHHKGFSHNSYSNHHIQHAQPPKPHRYNPCKGNTPTTRSQWCQYNIDTDYTEVPVDTGVTREYWLEVTDVVVAPDGVARSAMAINGTIPGPTIIADWGDTVKVHLTNRLTTSLNGTSFHFHGMRQNRTNANDGVPAITQCPLAVGESMTYTWKAEQYGSSWYHSHFSLQAYQGVFGGIIINGPASANYDEDLGSLFLQDWDHETADALYDEAQSSAPPELDNGLINGTNVFGEDGSASQTGSRLELEFEEGKSYRIRLVNSAIDTFFRFSIDHHDLTVISSDFVPVKPFTVKTLGIGMGQRHDIIVKANKGATAKDFWLRAVPQAACCENSSPNNIKAIVRYRQNAWHRHSKSKLPTTKAHKWTDSCEDETKNLVPIVSKQVSKANWQTLATASIGLYEPGMFKWYLNSTTMMSDWKHPTLQPIANGTAVTKAYKEKEAVFELKEANKWVYFVVATQMAFPHPIHLHGHDFFVLAQAAGTYDVSVKLNLDNPPRRDTAMLPASGYLVLAWQTDNPGVWLMHCHIGWHASEGFAVQFIERASEIPTASVTDADQAQLDGVCAAWNEFQTLKAILQPDSGI